MKEKWIVELEDGVWLTSGEGDPPRTLNSDSAKVFPSKAEAEDGLAAAKKHRPFRNARIYGGWTK